MNQARPKLSLRKRIAFSVIVTAVFFGLAECLFRGIEFIEPPQHVDFGLGFNNDSRLFVESSLHPGRMETHPAKRVSFVRQRFDQSKPEDTYRILALGGSSVNYLEPEFQDLE